MVTGKERFNIPFTCEQMVLSLSARTAVQMQKKSRSAAEKRFIRPVL